MDIVADLEASCLPARLFAEIDDLARYPEWLSIVPRAVAAEPAHDDEGPAWLVDLRGRLGPLARSKRLRMVRTLHEAPNRVRFERRERDGRQHSEWVLEAEVTAVAGAARSRLVMKLHYGGSFGGALLERMLRDEIDHSRRRLLERVTG
ncbi:MAG: SRPBCC family protein [Acidimicrobiales bacterium]|nr:SRPBCC family protein [Acidimicrobiales bacterium]